MYLLTNDRVDQLFPTQEPESMKLIWEGVRWTSMDIICTHEPRRLWRELKRLAIGSAVFMVDAADRSRMQEAVEMLDSVLNNPDLKDKPVAILGNKIDIPIAADEDKLRAKLALFTPDTIVIDCYEVSNGRIACGTIGGDQIGVFSVPSDHDVDSGWLAKQIMKKMPLKSGRFCLVDPAGNAICTGMMTSEEKSASPSGRLVKLFMVCVCRREGYAEACRWLAKVLS